MLGKNPAADIQLIYFSRSGEQCIFRKELERLDRFHAGLQVQFHFTRKEGNYHDPARRLTGEGLLGLVSDPATHAVLYLRSQQSGQACMEGLHSAGVSESQIRIELFNRPPITLTQTELKPRLITFLPASLLGKTRHIRQRKVETILETARQAAFPSPRNAP
ncbi:MAG: hypothetical protein R3F38_04735 [Gammaproteobacteria bacterium]